MIVAERTSSEISELLIEVNKRLDEFDALHAAAEGNADATIKAVAMGTADLSALNDANAAASNLARVVAELREQKRTLETELSEAQAFESHEDLISNATAISEEAEISWNEYFQAWQTALIEIKRVSENVVAAQGRHWKSRVAFRALPEPLKLIHELNDRGVETAGLRSVPLESVVMDFSAGNDITAFDGFGAGDLLGLIRQIHRKIEAEERAK